MADGPTISSVDRILAAVTLVAGAAAIAWPAGRKAPRIASNAAALLRHLWARRAWWITEEVTPVIIDGEAPGGLATA